METRVVDVRQSTTGCVYLHITVLNFLNLILIYLCWNLECYVYAFCQCKVAFHQIHQLIHQMHH